MCRALCFGLLVSLVTTLPATALPAPRVPARETVTPPLANSTLVAHAEDVVDYTLRATLDPVRHTVHGEGTIVWRNRSDSPVGELWLHLYLNAFKNERSAFLRERVGGRGSAPLEDWGWIDVRKLVLRERDGESINLWPTAELHRPDAASQRDDEADETDVRVPLPHTIAPGSEATLDVVFDDKLPSVVLRTGYRGSFHMVGQWFPKLARLERDGRWAHFAFHHLSEFYADFGSYDVTLDVPERFKLGATGPAVESNVVAGRRVERHVQRDVHDFAWTAWDEYETAHAAIDGVDVTLLYPPGYARVVGRELQTLRFALPYYSARYGRYPYDVLTVAHPPQDAAEAGGMEYPTLITTDAPWWTPACVRAPEVVTIHELAHQWFYGIVASSEAAWPLLDEGLTQFAEIEAMAKWRGEGSLVDLAGLELSDAVIQAIGSNNAVHDEPIAQAASAFSSGANYQRLVYARTSSILATLARVYGEEAVDGALGLYARRYRFQHPDPEDFIAAFRDALGERVGATLHTALFDKGWVDYAVDGLSTQRAQRTAGFFDDGGGRHKIEPGASDDGGWSSSVLVRRRGTLSFPVDVELWFADGSNRRERWNGDSDWTKLTPQSSSALTHAVVDPDDRVLVDMNLENNRGAAGGGRSSAMRSIERVTYWMQLALQAVSP